MFKVILGSFGVFPIFDNFVSRKRYALVTKRRPTPKALLSSLMWSLSVWYPVKQRIKAPGLLVGLFTALLSNVISSNTELCKILVLFVFLFSNRSPEGPWTSCLYYSRQQLEGCAVYTHALLLFDFILHSLVKKKKCNSCGVIYTCTSPSDLRCLLKSPALNLPPMSIFLLFFFYNPLLTS